MRLLLKIHIFVSHKKNQHLTQFKEVGQELLEKIQVPVIPEHPNFTAQATH